MTLLAQHGLMMGNLSGVTFATLNPSDKGGVAGIVLSGGDLTATVGASPAAGSYYLARSTIGKSTGKWYWETTIFRSGPLANNYSYGSCVLCDIAYAMEQTGVNFPGVTADVAGGPYFGDGTYVNNINVKSHSGVTGTFVIRHVLDMDAGTYAQAFDAGAFTTVMSGLSESMYPAVMIRQAASPVGPPGFATQNFGRSPFVYAVPAGVNPGIFEYA